jgi:hypothetical protein
MRIIKLAEEIISLEQLSPTEWDVTTSGCDFHIRIEDGQFAVDAFDRFIKDAEAAYLDSTLTDTFEEALQLCRDFESWGRSFNPPNLQFPPGFGE